jgi:cell division protein FtsL
LRRTGRKREVIKKFFFILLVFFAVVLLGIFYVWERATAVQLTLLLSKKEKELDTVQNKIEKLRLEYLDLSSVIRIERIAKEQLHMKYPSSKEIRYIHVD